MYILGSSYETKQHIMLLFEKAFTHILLGSVKSFPGAACEVTVGYSTSWDFKQNQTPYPQNKTSNGFKEYQTPYTEQAIFVVLKWNK